jgi:hypothetical protein
MHGEYMRCMQNHSQHTERRNTVMSIKMDYGGIVCVVDSSGSGQCQMADCCEEGNEPLGSRRGGEYLDSLSNYQLCKYSVSYR